MEFRILGSMEVLDGTRRVELPSGRGRALLALLVLNAGQPVSAERLIDELWGEDPPPTAATVVQGLVSRLRTVLEPQRGKGEPATVLQTVGNGYRLDIDPDAVDANRFKHLLDASRGAPPEMRATALGDALALWRGAALVDFTYEPFAQRAITALSELRIEATEDRIEADLECGGGADLVAELQELVAEHPYRERLRGFLMVALYRAGRQSDALDAYRSARTTLVDEVGLDPGPVLRELEAAILRQDPTLEVRGIPREEPARTWLPTERRTVTVAAVDVAPVVAPAVDAEAVGRIAARAARVAGEVLERHGARVESFFGDTLIAFFGFPSAHEDDALRAVRAAVEARIAVAALNGDASTVEGVRHCFRAGLETGDIVVEGPGTGPRDLVAGTVVSTAGRLQQAAADGEIVVGPATQRLIRGAVIMKPTAGDSTAAWSVIELVSGAPMVSRALEAPIFGRQEELTRLRSAFRRVVRTGHPVHMTVLGEAGIGKSRLARELIASVGTDAHAMTLRSPAYGGSATFFPLREALVHAAGFHGWQPLHALLAADNDGQVVPPDIASAIALRAVPASVDALFPAAARLLGILAGVRPLIVVLEDLHWSEPTVLDLVDYLAREVRAPVFVVGVARPELIERRPEWRSENAIELEPLPPSEIAGIVVDRGGPIAPSALGRIVEVSGGNPLFAEQLLAALDERAVGEVPASLHGLLTMRLDRLGPGERDVLRAASVAGIESSADAVSALLGDAARPFVHRHLDSLERKRLIVRKRGSEFEFGHVLIQLASYQSMTREDRGRLHERFADWLAHEAPDTPAGLEEVLDYHRAQAAEHRRASGVIEGA